MNDPPPSNVPPSSSSGSGSVAATTSPRRPCIANPYAKKNKPQLPQNNHQSNLNAFVSPMGRKSSQTSLPTSSTKTGYKNGIILYDQFAIEKKKPKFDELKPCHLTPANFKALSITFLNWIANSKDLKNKHGSTYGASTLPQYFSNWHNAVLNHDDPQIQEMLAKDQLRPWHNNMTSSLKKRLMNKGYNSGIEMNENNTSCRRSVMIKLIQHLLLACGTDEAKQRDAWEYR